MEQHPPFDAVAAAKSIVPTLAAVSLLSERERCLHPQAVTALSSSGLTKTLAPRRYGGYQRSVSDHILSCVETARGCAAASWVQMVCGAHTFVLGGFSQACQDEVFSSDPGVLIAGSLAAQGTIERRGDGWLLNGKWQFCSGIDHSPWILIGARQTGAEQDPEAVFAAHVLVPKAQLRIDDTWHVLGMRGTGSKDIVAENVDVLAHRVMPTQRLFLGLSPHAAEPVYRLPVLCALASMVAGTTLGIAESGLHHFVEYTKRRRDMYGGSQKALSVGMQRRLAESTAEIVAARLMLQDICRRFDLAILDPPPLSLERRVSLRWHAAYVVELCRRAVERVYAVAGAHAVYDASPLQRWFRDMNTVTHHAIVDFETLIELDGKLALGIDTPTERNAPIA